MTTLAAPIALARLSPAISASYSTSLLVVGKLRRTIHSTVSPSSDSNTALAPPPSGLSVGRSVRMYAPQRRLFCPLVLVVGKFCYEVHNDLSFDGGPWAILDAKLAQLYDP